MAKPLLERHTIFDTAIDIVNEQGADNLSIRRLTSELSCSPNTIYAQVGNRDELVDGLLNYFFSSFSIRLNPADEWQAQARKWGSALRRCLIDNPNIARLIGWRQRPVITRSANGLFKAFIDAGFGHDLAMRCVRVLIHETISLSLTEIESPPLPARRARGRKKPSAGKASTANPFDQGHNFKGFANIFDSAIDFTLRGIEQTFAEQSIAETGATKQ